MNSPSKHFIHSVLTDKRYWFLLILFCFLFVFGKKVGVQRGPEQLFRQPAFLERKDITLINVVQDVYTAQNVLSTIPGQSYRIIFSYAVNEDDAKVEPFVQNVEEKDFLDINIISKGGKEKLIDKLEITKLNSWLTHEVLFTADDYYSSIFFKKDIAINTKDILIANIEVDELEVEDLSLISQGIYGDVEVVEGSEIFDLKNRNIVVGLNKKPMSFLQTFTAENNDFYGIDIAMKFFGNGGSGDYMLDLVNLDEQNQQKGIINTVQFNVSAENIYQISSDVYRFVLPAKLVKGQKYGLKISNSNVIIGFFHHLQIYGENNSDENIDPAYTVIKGKQKIIGKSSVKPLYVNRVKFGDNSLLLDSRLRAISQNKSFYSYNFANRAENILDVYETNTAVSLDKEQQAFVAKYQNGSEFFIIKVWTKDTISQLNLLASQYEDIMDNYSILEYSFNKENWQKIEPYGKVYSNLYNFILIPEIKTNEIYFRISPEKQDNAQQAGKFGLSRINISAILEIK